MKVSIIMGSLSDSPIADKVVSKLMEFGVVIYLQKDKDGKH